MPRLLILLTFPPEVTEQYRARHDALWPELAVLLHQAGVRDYSIFLEADSGKLFAVLRRTPDHCMDSLPLNPLMQRWWTSMADLMETSRNYQPLTQPLIPMFHLP